MAGHGVAVNIHAWGACDGGFNSHCPEIKHMFEKFPQPERPEPKIIGPASPEKKEEYKREISERFGEKHFEKMPEEIREVLEKFESAKLPHEVLAIEKANEITNSILEEFGLKPFDIPERNIHIIPEDHFKKLTKDLVKDQEVGALTFQKRQMILINSDLHSHSVAIDMAATILHEMIHLKGFLSLEAYEDLCKFYRSGMKIFPSRKKMEEMGYAEIFKGLNEAIVTEIQKKYLPQLIKENRLLVEEYRWQSSNEIQNLKKKIAQNLRIKPDEIIWVSKDGKSLNVFPYYEQRVVLNYIVDVIFEDNKEKFSSREDVMKLFFKSHFDGKLLEIARLIKKSFGPDAFRIIGMMDEENEDLARLILDYLIKHRKKK